MKCIAYKMRILCIESFNQEYNQNSILKDKKKGRNKDFLISDEVITFTDRSGRLLAMKPDVTLSIIKNAPDVSGEVQKVYYNENVYRVSGGTHSFCEIMQTGLECIGDLNDYEISEVVLLAAQSLWKISKDFILDISHMGLISSVLENCTLSKKDKDKVREYLKQYQLEDRVMEFEVSSATVALAAQALNCEECRIAKTLSFHVNDKVVLIVAAGDAKIDNPKFKAQFACKAKMLSFEEAEPLIGHAVGGGCPFAINDSVDVYLDTSLKRFETVFPACGSSNSAIELTLEELEQYSNCLAWIDVCKGWSE